MQIEDCRWTQVPNDFIDKGAMAEVGPIASCIYWCIARKTKGWQKEYDEVSVSQLEKMTGISRKAICRAIEKLIVGELLLAVKISGKTTKYCLKLFTSVSGLLDHATTATSTSSLGLLTKETLKETIQNINTDTSCPSPSVPVNEFEPSDEFIKPKKKGTKIKSRSQADPRVKTLQSYYVSKFLDKVGYKPNLPYDRSTKEFKILLKIHDEATIRAVIDVFFAYEKRTSFAWANLMASFDNLLGRAGKKKEVEVDPEYIRWNEFRKNQFRPRVFTEEKA